MSTKVKKCKTCGTTEASNFAPRKSVICKSCDSGGITTPPTIPSVSIPSEIIPEVVVSTPSESMLSETTENLSTEIINNDEKSLRSIVENLEETVKQLQEEVRKFSKLKKLFPRVFPEDNL